MRQSFPIETPQTWPKEPAKFILLRKKRPVRRSDGIVTAFRDGEVTLRENRRTEGFTNAVQEIGYQAIRRGDLVVHGMDGFAGAIGVSDSDGKASPVVHAYVGRPGIDVRFYAYLLRTMASNGFVASLAKGIRQRSTSFDPSTLGSLELPAPSPRTQDAIADFLDRETERIDRLVEKKRRLIELLEEKRTALISHAVTKGLDPTAPMKDSGIPWLGEIPAHWRATRLKWLLARNDGGVWGDEPRGDESDRIVVRSTEIALDGSWRLDGPAVRSLRTRDFAKARLEVGDIVVVKSSGSADHVGKAAIVDSSIAEIPCAFANFVQRLRPGNDVRSDFLFYVLNARAGREQLFYWSATTTGLRNLNGSTIGDLVFPQPPIQEQIGIAEHLMKATGTIEEADAKLARQLDLLAEYRHALITAAVTGQIDVTREAPEPEEVVA